MNSKTSKDFIAKNIRQFKQLRADIDMHDRLYYRENNPQISDFEYDCLKAELLRIQGVLKNVGIDTNEDKIGNDLSNGFSKVQHLSPMQSLANTYSYDELLAFDNRVSKQLNGRKYTYVVEPKIDGVAVNLIYKNGHLEHALTRGDGTTGDEVLQNILTIENLPTELQNCPEIIEIRGEVFIDEETFDSENEYRNANGMEEYANPRNLAAGTIKSLDVEDVKKRHLRAIFYAIGYSSNTQFSTQQSVLEQLPKWGFHSQEKFWHVKDIDEAWQSIAQLDIARKNFKYWTDGAVLKINELDLHKELGTTAKAPHWAIAYKFAPTRVSTMLKDIIFQVGRTGVITPIAVLDPIEIDGSVITRATLHNADDIARKDIRIGDYVFLEKAGEIIPAIVSVDLDRRNKNSKPFSFPTKCPSCNQPLERIADEVAWRCLNPNCPEQLKCKITYFVSKDALNIDGLGETVIQNLIAQKKVHNVADIYRLTFRDLLSIPKLGQKSALKILDNIDKSKNCHIWRIINGLGILGIGEQTAKDLAQQFSSIQDLSHATTDQLANISGIGQKLAESIVKFFQSPAEQSLIKQLEDLGLRLNSQPVDCQGDTKIFDNKIFVLTGTLDHFTRAQIKEIIEILGGNVSETISKKVDILIVGSNPGSKLSQAEKLKITIWSESDLIQNCLHSGVKIPQLGSYFSNFEIKH
ncbi:MAG: NAD-dependent DNA ligase LigA [Opitutales bacterium]|nr:NAD-dependent DNA ligase LigA [Opitutales bacterium]